MPPPAPPLPTPMVCIHFSFALQDGLTSLFIASQEGHTEVVDTLLKKGANPNLACTVWKVVCTFSLCILGYCSALRMHIVYLTDTCMMHDLPAGGLGLVSCTLRTVVE